MNHENMVQKVSNLINAQNASRKPLGSQENNASSSMQASVRVSNKEQPHEVKMTNNCNAELLQSGTPRSPSYKTDLIKGDIQTASSVVKGGNQGSSCLSIGRGTPEPHLSTSPQRTMMGGSGSVKAVISDNYHTDTKIQAEQEENLEENLNFSQKKAIKWVFVVKAFI